MIQASKKRHQRKVNIKKTANKSDSLKIMMFVVLGCFAMAFVDRFITTYIWKSLFKIVLFLGLPTLFFITKKQPLPAFLLRPTKKQFTISFLLGLLVFIFILSAYFILGPFFDFNQVVGALESNVGVTKDNFVLVSIYISLINSLLEESFFRGFAYLVLRQYTSQLFASLFSALVFALYHVAIMTGWFSLPLLTLLISSLVIAGLLFNFVVSKTNTIFSSWFVHMFANFAINVIGFMLFGIL